MTSYTHFTREERSLLSLLYVRGCTQKEIAREIGKSQSSISRELARNSYKDGKYHAGIARRKADERRKKASFPRRRIENDPRLKQYILRKLKKFWSPEQIAGRVRLKHNTVICHETIYKYIYNERPDLKKYLRCQKGKYRRRYGTRKRERVRKAMKKRRIDERPPIIDHRVRVGDWEGDTVVGAHNSGSLVTYVERKTGYTMIEYVPRATAQAIQDKTIKRFSEIPKYKRHSVTYDNGSEFSYHEQIERKTDMTVYFAHPYHSWERGTNENTNGLIRQFFPKKRSFKHISNKATKLVEQFLNHRPRKRLNYLTPAEAFKLCT